MSDKMQICRACLATNVNLSNIHDKKITELYTSLMGVSISRTDGMPPYICGVCTHLLRKFQMYRDRCHSSLEILQNLVLNNKLTVDQINEMERKGILNLCQTTTLIIGYESTEPTPNQTVQQYLSIEDRGSMTSPKNETLTKQENEIDIGDVKKDFYNDEEIVFDEQLKMDPFDDMSDSEESVLGEVVDEDIVIRSDSEMSFHEEPLVENPVTVGRKRKLHMLGTKDVENDEETTKGNQKRMILTKVTSFSDPNRKTKAPTEEDEAFEKDCKIFFENFPTTECGLLQRKKVIIKQMKFLDTFAKAYNYTIKYLTKEEQLKDFEDKKARFEYMTYQCHICYQGYKRKDAYDTHMLAHDPVAGGYVCDICGFRKKTKSRLRQHRKDKHYIRFICKICGQLIKNIKSGREHFALHGKARFTCEICLKTFKTSAKYFDHIRNVHKEDGVFSRAYCPICCQMFHGESGVTVHMKMKHRQAVQCNTCNMYFERRSALSKHLEDSMDGACAEGVKACNQCGEGFETVEDLTDHFLQHENTFNTCVRCKKAFESPYSLDEHWDSCCPPGGGGGGGGASSSYKPRICNRKPRPGRKPRAKSDKPRAANGSQKHHNQKFICEVCGKEIRQYRSQLESHMRMHTGEKPYKCTYCSKTFRMQAMRLRHELMHTGGRPYHCELCDSAFRQSAHLRAHMIVHTGEKPYVCDICNKAFTGSGSVREHKRTVHEGQPPRRRLKNKLHTVKVRVT